MKRGELMLNIIPEDRGVKPKVGWLNVNRACNMRCEWCYAKGTEYSAGDEMSLDLAIRLVEMMRSTGVKTSPSLEVSQRYGSRYWILIASVTEKVFGQPLLPMGRGSDAIFSGRTIKKHPPQ